MAKLLDEDQFIVGHGGRVKETLKVSFNTLKNSVAPLAIPPVRNPDGSVTPGVAGKMFPGPGLTYNPATGELQSTSADSLRLVGLIEADDQKPRSNAEQGDFYISAGNYQLLAVDWPGLTDARYLDSIETIHEGSGYRPQSGDWYRFGEADDLYSKIVPTKIYGAEGGLVLKVSVLSGAVVGVEITESGSNYRMDQVLELQSSSNDKPYSSGYVKVTSIDTYGEVQSLVLCYADGTTEIGGVNIESTGSSYILPPGRTGSIYAMQTIATSGSGVGLVVSFNVFDGRIDPDSVVEAISSTPRGYADGERVYVYNTDGNPGDALLEVKLNTSTEKISVGPNDKIVYTSDYGSGAGYTYKIVPDFIAGQSLFDVVAAPGSNLYGAYSRARRSSAGYNTLEIDIADVDDINSGLMSPEMFSAIDGLVPGAQPGTVVEIISAEDKELYSNDTFEVLDVVNVPLNASDASDDSKNVILDVLPAVIGKRGTIFIASQQALDHAVAERFLTGGSSDKNNQESTTSNILQQANTFMPQNFSTLPKHPNSTNP